MCGEVPWEIAILIVPFTSFLHYIYPSFFALSNFVQSYVCVCVCAKKETVPREGSEMRTISKFGSQKFRRVWVSCSRITAGFSPQLLKTWKTATSMDYNSISRESNDFLFTRRDSVSFKCYTLNIVNVPERTFCVSSALKRNRICENEISFSSRCWENTRKTLLCLTKQFFAWGRTNYSKKLFSDSGRWAGRVFATKAASKEPKEIIQRPNGTRESLDNWLSNWKAYWLGAWSNQRICDRMSKWLCEWTIRPVDPALKWWVS